MRAPIVLLFGLKKGAQKKKGKGVLLGNLVKVWVLGKSRLKGLGQGLSGSGLTGLKLRFRLP